jgi:hypothetical protein
MTYQGEGHEDNDGNFWRDCICTYDAKSKGCSVCEKNPILPICFGCAERISQTETRVKHERSLNVAGVTLDLKLRMHMQGKCIDDAARRIEGIAKRMRQELGIQET